MSNLFHLLRLPSLSSWFRLFLSSGYRPCVDLGVDFWPFVANSQRLGNLPVGSILAPAKDLDCELGRWLIRMVVRHVLAKWCLLGLVDAVSVVFVKSVSDTTLGLADICF